MFRRRAKAPKTPATAGALDRTAPAAGRGRGEAGREPFTYIQRGTTIVGQLRAEGRVRVHGVVRGDVKVDGALEVAEDGLVEGVTIEAHEVKIIGRVVVERLVASGKVEIWDGGELLGDVRAASLDIEEGARFTGRSEMAGGSEAPPLALLGDGPAAEGGAEPGAQEVELDAIEVERTA